MISDFLYIGHRGTRTDLDENTFDAFKIAVDYGANFIELDVRKTRDKKFIILHDKTLDRTTTGSGLVKNYDYVELKKILTRNNRFQIPLLSEVLLGLKEKTYFIIELKDESLREDVPKIVKEYSLLKKVIFSGRVLQDLKSIKIKYPQSSICYNITKGVDFTLTNFMKQSIRLINDFKPEIISLKSTLISPKFIEMCHKNNILAVAWDFHQRKNPLKWIKSIIKLGIDGILFDNHKNIPKIKSWIETSKKLI